MLDFGFYNMDCMEGMKQFPDKYFDLAIVDPPYGDAKLSENSGGVLEQIRAEVRQVQVSTDSGRTCDSQAEHGVIRVGGGWARKYTKKSLRGTQPPEKSILMSFFVSHVTRLSGGGITSSCHQHGAFLFGES